MARTDVQREMKEMFGEVISFIDEIPDQFIDAEWDLIKRVQFGPTLIPNKYKELIGLGVAAVTKCRYCVLFHTESAKLFGATDEEVEGEWAWVTGRPVTKAQQEGWALDNHEGSQHWLCFWRDTNQFDDGGAGSRLPFVCEWDDGPAAIRDPAR